MLLKSCLGGKFILWSVSHFSQKCWGTEGLLILGGKKGRKGRFSPLPPIPWKCTALVIEKGMCCWQGYGRRADEDLLRTCTAIGITGADPPESSLGWLGKGKHTLPNSSERLKTTECPENPERLGKIFLLQPIKPHMLFMAGLALFAQRLGLEAQAVNSILSPLSNLPFSRHFITWHPLMSLLSDHRDVQPHLMFTSYATGIWVIDASTAKARADAKGQ